MPCFLLFLYLFASSVVVSNAQQTSESALTGFDELYLTTAPLEILAGKTRVGTATGFFVQASPTSKIFLVTNRHVVIDEEKNFYPDRLQFRLHIDSNDLRRSDFYELQLYSDKNNSKRLWREISPKNDVVAIELDLERLKKFHIKHFNLNQFAPPGTSIAVGEPVAVLGYPVGFSDDLHNLPVARQGAVASAFPIPFRGKRFFLVDAILHPGTSGSPVVTRPAATRVTTTGGIVPGPRVHLIGISSGSFGGLNLNIVWFTSVITELLQ